MTDPQIDALAGSLHVDPKEVRTAIALMRSGRTELINAVITKKMTIAAAIRVLRTGEEGRGVA